MDNNKEFVNRLIAIALVVFLVAVLLVGKTFKIAVLEGERWRAYGDSLYVKQMPIKADRGDILADDGSLLSTSVPFFDIRMDLKAPGLTDQLFSQHVDSLAILLSNYFYPDKSPSELVRWLRRERKEGNRYLSIKKDASYGEMQMLRTFPLLRLSPNKGGWIAERETRRQKPLRQLASRTIGLDRENAQSVGLEESFDQVLSGEQGHRIMKRVARGVYIPVDDLARIEPKRGMDVRTTLNVEIQDFAQQALIQGLLKHQAEKGVAIVMEVKTGAIKAIVNLQQTSSGGYAEQNNDAVMTASEPGSTFKAASVMALLEDKLATPESRINFNRGRWNFFDKTMFDSSPHDTEVASLQHAFVVSSNVGISRLVAENYAPDRKAGLYIEKLRQFHLHEKTGIELIGEAEPFIKEAYNTEQRWSGVSLPWMSVGYELKLTPLQILRFYNAIANDGTMMKPYLVSAIQSGNEVKQEFKPVVVDKRIASPETIRAMQEMMKEVVEEGTAKGIKSPHYSFAGKTGTARTDYYKNEERRMYNASFAGFFPAEDPVFSCIVVIYHPKVGGIYGGDVAGPVFRSIADKCMAMYGNDQRYINDEPKPILASHQLPRYDVGKREEMEALCRMIGLDYDSRSSDEFAIALPDEHQVRIESRRVDDKLVPNVLGMGLRDAVYAIERAGARPRIYGVGKVARQEPEAGAGLKKGQIVDIKLE